jgi:uracil phosphoribosyltransferase
MLTERGVTSVTGICLLAAPEGLRHLDEAFPGPAPGGAGPAPGGTSPAPGGASPAAVRVVTAAVDARLDSHGYIVPGLGDAGDRLFGKV